MSGHADTIRSALNMECECEECKPARAALDALLAENQRLREALNGVCNELGVPQPGYPQSVANAYWIARETLEGDT